jgi:hypothetical protein
VNGYSPKKCVSQRFTPSKVNEYSPKYGCRRPFFSPLNGYSPKSPLVYNLTGENLFEAECSGVSIKKALDYLFYYNQHPEEWKWHDKPNTGVSGRWPYNLFEAMSGIYGDSGYVEFVRDSRPLLYPVHHFAWVFPTLMPVSLDGYR